MTTRIRIPMTWDVFRNLEGRDWSQTEDFIAYARQQLVDGFLGQNADLRIDLIVATRERLFLDLDWDFDLPPEGDWASALEHARFAQAALVDAIPLDGSWLYVTGIYQEIPLEAAVDHGDILRAAMKAGVRPAPDAYPVYLTDRDPDWPEARQVFVVNGGWCWTDGDGTAVGPQPARIFRTLPNPDAAVAA